MYAIVCMASHKNVDEKRALRVHTGWRICLVGASVEGGMESQRWLAELSQRIWKNPVHSVRTEQPSHQFL